MANPTNSISAALAREEEIEQLALEIEGKINGASADLAVAALARALNRLSHRGDRKLEPATAIPAVTSDGAKQLADAHRGLTGKVLQALAAKPRQPLAELAQAVYGAQTRVAQGKVRSLLAALKKANKATNVGHGEWEVVPPI